MKCVSHREEEQSMPTMTAAQKRAQAKVDYDAFLAGCPSRQLLDRISDKWVALVLAALGATDRRPQRYSRAVPRLAGVSQKMLTQTLRSLERDGLVTRTVTPTVPVTVTYELTDLGRSLQVVMHGSRGGPRRTWTRCWPPGPPMMRSHDLPQDPRGYRAQRRRRACRRLWRKRQQEQRRRQRVRQGVRRQDRRGRQDRHEGPRRGQVQRRHHPGRQEDHSRHAGQFGG